MLNEAKQYIPLIRICTRHTLKDHTEAVFMCDSKFDSRGQRPTYHHAGRRIVVNCTSKVMTHTAGAHKVHFECPLV